MPQIEVMAGKWGEYPFLDEKYGNATVFFGGGMEHQTMTTLAVGSVGDPWMEWLNVHELGHQWWGDWITMDDWRHIWLNEGFATHTEWLWAEHLGPAVFAQYLEDEDYLGQFRGAVYDNPEPFSWTIYAKGSWVAWMLRHVIGDAAFFDAMAAYRTAHGGATATTDNLREAMEAASGMQLDWFFDQWVYGLYRPRYVYDWRNIGDFVLELEVRQVQTNTGLFRMPVDVRVTTAAGVENHRVWFEAEAEQSIEIQLQAPATAVAVDPDTKLLAEIAHVSQPDLELGPDFPDGYDFGVVAGADRAIRALPLTNTGGVDLVVEGIWPQSGGSFRLNDPPEFPLTIAPGDTHSVEILYDPTGFGRQTDRFYIGSNDPDREGAAYLRVAGTGSLYEEAFLAVPSAASAGRVPLGGTGQAAFDALNLGGEPLAVQVTIEGDDFFPANIVPPVLAPGSSNVIRVRFQPTTVGAASGSVIFHTGNPADPLKTVNLSAIVDGAPRLELSPAALSLGVGDGSATASLLAVNSGTEDLIISTVAVEPPFVLSDPQAGPVTVPPGASGVITVGLHDSPTGTLDGRLTLHSNDPAVPVARVPLRAHVTDGPVDEASFAAAASGPGLGDSRWTTRAFLLNPTDRALQTDLVFRPAGQRAAGVPDVGFEVPARSQRVIPDLVAAAGAAGTGGVNLRSSGAGLVAVSRTSAAGSGGSYGQFIGAESHIDALDGDRRYLLAGLAGNGGFHSNVGVLNLGGDSLTIDLSVFGPGGDLIGTRRLTAQPGAFTQLVAVISKLTGEVVRGGYATFTAVEADARYLAYGSVVDDASNDPTLVLPQDIDNSGSAADLVVPAVASLPGAAGTMWRSQLDLVNTTSEPSSVTLEYVRADGSSVTSMAMELAPGAALHLDDVVGDLFGEHGKGWLRVSASGGGILATSRTFNDDANGTYGQLISAAPAMSAVGPSVTVLLPGLSSRDGLRTNLGLTSLAPETTSCTIRVFDNDGAAVGELPAELPPRGFVQIERALAGELGYIGDAWAEVSCSHPSAAFFAHASVIDEITGDPTTIPAIVINE